MPLQNFVKMSEVCFICNESLTEGEIVVVDRGLKTLIDSSTERSDGFNEYLKNKTSVTIHKQCRKAYTRKSSIAAAKRQRDAEIATTPGISPPRTRIRSNESSFCFKKYCLFCGNEADKTAEMKKAQHLRRRVSQVSTLDFKKTILKEAQTRSDELARSVIARIQYEYDLVAAKAMYHSDCYTSFVKPISGGKIGRPESDSITSAMEKIFAFIENHDDCQFSIQELKDICKEPSIDNRTIKSKLKSKYGNRIIITEKLGSSAFICFIDNQHDVLSKAWYEKKKENEMEERLRILKAAAAIVREDIQSIVFDTDNYPPPTQMFEDINSDIPESLTYLLEQIILKNKRSKLEHSKLICTNVSHCIMAAVRPRSFKSRLQLGLSVFFHRRFGSKRLIQIFSSFGLCASYNETMMYEAAAVLHRPPHILPPETGTIIQYAADNADINVHTLDGHNTLHIMGIIQIITPKAAVIAEKPISRVNRVLSAKDFAAKAHVPIKVYQNDGAVGYSKIVAQNFDYESSTAVALLKKVDILWLYGKWKDLLLPGWNGYIELVTSNITDFSKSQILFLPFIQQPASNYNTIYTTLLYALENAKRYNHDVCIITFDQPLYAKAREIVSAAPEGSEVSKIVVRLGGFHLLMSFFGAIGQIMQGSGIKEVLSLIYATNSLDKMLNGHAYARAVRAHTLLHLTLATIISEELVIDDEMHANLQDTVNLIMNNTISYVDIENGDEMAEALLEQFNKKLKEYEQRGPTAKLWTQYFHMVSIAKEFVRAERMGDWKAHLNSIREMLPYFHASGHFHYAKSAHLYLQDMLQLKNLIDDPEVFERFTSGFFTIRRSDKLSCGTSTDMVIEQSMMKSMKTDGGVARGRSTQESAISKWIYGMHAMNTVCERLEDLADVSMDTTDQQGIPA